MAAGAHLSRPVKTAMALGVFVGCMVGVAYAAVPLYELFCRVTGFGGTTQVATEAQAAGIYFHKMHCFCFEMQHLAPEQGVEMGVVFFVDPEILEDPANARIDTITLSYTMLATDAPNDDEVAALTETTE